IDERLEEVEEERLGAAHDLPHILVDQGGKDDRLAVAAGRLRLDARQAFLGSDRKSTRLNSSHLVISYAVFCLKKKKKTNTFTFTLIPPQRLRGTSASSSAFSTSRHSITLYARTFSHSFSFA